MVRCGPSCFITSIDPTLVVQILRENARVASKRRRVALGQAQIAQEEEERLQKAIDVASKARDEQAEVAVIPPPEPGVPAIDIT